MFNVTLQGERDSLDLDGYIFSAGECGAIFLRTEPDELRKRLHFGDLPPRLRYSAAHELGHFMVDVRPLLAANSQNVTSIACTALDMQRPKFSRPNRTSSREIFIRERRANRFAAELLMPAEDVLEFLGTRAFPITCYTLDAMTKRYHVSLKAAAFRLVELSVEPCVLVVSRQGRVKQVAFSRALRGNPNYAIPGPRAFGENTSAFRMLKRYSKQNELWGPHDANQWFPNCPQGHSQVMEFSRISTRFNEVLSLLHLDRGVLAWS